MSLLDDVSIVVTPNGYKAGTLFAVKPTDVLGSEEITNGDFSNELTDWTENGGSYATIVSGALNSNNPDAGNWYAENISQNVSFVNGTTYKLTFKAKNISGNLNLRITQGANPMASLDLTSTFVDYTYFYTANADNGSIRIFCNDAVGQFQIDNISVKEVTGADMDVTRATAATRVDENGLVNYAEILGGEEVTDGNFPSGTTDWTFGAGWSIGTNKAERLVAASSTDLVQASVFPNLTSTFKISFDVVRSAGSVRLRAGTYSLPYVSATDTYIYYVTPVSNDQLKFQADSSFIGSITNISVKEATRDNVPRIDYTGGGCPHILAEPQRTNGIPYSEDFSQSTWIASNQTVSLSGVLSPNGTSFSYKLTATANYSKIREDLVLNATTTYTVSFYTKNISAANPRIVVYDQNNSVTLLSQSYGSELSSSEWVRITGTFTTTTAATIQLQICRDLMNSEEMLIWGTQLEEGSYATSYIPTSGSTVTRNQDIFTRDGIGSLINSTEGVLFLEVAALSNDETRYITLSDGVLNNNAIRIYYHATGVMFFQKYVVGTRTTNINTSSLTQTDFNKLAVRYNSTTVDVWANGVQILTNADTNVIASGTLNKLAFEQGNGTSNPFYGKVKQLQVYTTALTDTQLAALTS